MMCIGALLACLLLLACRTEIEAEPTPTPIPTEAPTPSPEPVVLLTVQEPTDAKTLSAQIAAEGTIETVVIDPGMLTNTDIAALLSTFPEVRFRYAVRLGDTYLPPDTASLSAENLQIEEIVDALPCFTALETVHLGMRTMEELAAAQRLLPGIALTYTTSLYGKEVDRDVETLDLSDLETLDPAELAAALPYLPELRTVSLGVRDDRKAAEAFGKAVPSVECTFVYRFTYLGRTLTDDIETLDLSKTRIKDLKKLKQVIALLPKLKRIEMIDCGLDDETMGALCDAYPEIKFVWEIDLGYWGKLRTDAKAYSSRSRKTPVQVKNKLKSKNVQYFRYCTDLVALDLGHQCLTDVSFLEPLKKLRVLILADNYISDISVLGELPDLEYIELFMNRVEDLSPLMNLTKLRDLNIRANKVSDFTPLCSIKTLERVWYAANDFAKEDHQMLKEALPNCILNYTAKTATADGWRTDKNGNKVKNYLWMTAFFKGAPRFE